MFDELHKWVDTYDTAVVPSNVRILLLDIDQYPNFLLRHAMYRKSASNHIILHNMMHQPNSQLNSLKQGCLSHSSRVIACIACKPLRAT